MRQTLPAPPRRGEIDTDGWPVGRPADVFARLLSRGINISGETDQGSPFAPEAVPSAPPNGLEIEVRS